jgi:hypothetical protein
MYANEPLRLTLVKSPVPGVDAVVSPADPVMGEWRADRSKGYLDQTAAATTTALIKRYGTRAQHGKGELGKWMFTPEGQGVRLQYFVDTGPDSSESALADFFSTWDGRPWADPYGPAFVGQLVQHWRLDRCMIVRLVLDNVTPAERLEWMTYAISTDGRTLAATSWDHAIPERHDLLVFNKHDGDSHYPSESRASRVIVVEPSASMLETDPILGDWVAATQEGGHRPEQASFFHRFNGSEHPEAAPSITEYLTSWKIDPCIIVRRVRTRNQRSYWSIYALTEDGSKMVVTSWDEAAPYDRHIQAFGR